MRYSLEFLKIYLTFPVKYPYYIVVFDLQKKGYTKMIHIRLASKEDIQNIMPLYAYARKFMATAIPINGTAIILLQKTS